MPSKRQCDYHVRHCPLCFLSNISGGFRNLQSHPLNATEHHCIWWDLPSHPGFLLVSFHGLPTASFWSLAVSKTGQWEGLGTRLAFSLDISTGGRATGGGARDCELSACMTITTYLFCSPVHQRALSLTWRTHDGHSMQNAESGAQSSSCSFHITCTCAAFLRLDAALK